MLRLKFFLRNDFHSMNTVLNEKIRLWMENWTFTNNCSVEVRELSASKKSVADDLSWSRAFNDYDFNWKNFIFGEFADGFVEDEILSSVIDQVKNKFIAEIFNLDLKSFDVGGSVVKKSSFKDGLTISMTVPEAGVIWFVSSQSALFGMLNKPVLRPKKNELTSRIEAIKGLEVNVKITKNFGDISFLDLVNINLGKTIKSQVDINNTFNFQIGSSSKFTVALGKKDNFKSVVIQDLKND